MTAWSIVLPTFREAANLQGLIPAIGKVVQDAGVDAEIIVVDDDSRDGTEDIIQALAQAGHPVRILVRKGVRGLGSAVLAGFREARGEVLICMDADFSHPPASLPDLAKGLGQFEMVFGSRYVTGGSTEEGWGLPRWLNSKVATLLARPFTALKDPMSGFFAMRRSAFLSAVELNPIGYKIGLELLVKARCTRVGEVPIPFANRKFGQSKLCLREQVNYLVHLKKLADFKWGWVSQFLQFSLVGLAGMGVDLSVYSLTLKAGWAMGVARWLAIALAMTFNFALNRTITFRQEQPGSLWLAYLRYCLASASGALVNAGISIGLVATHGFEAHKIAAAGLGILAGAGMNFYMARRWVFRPSPRNVPGPGL